MNEEFKAKQFKDTTVYTLESASSGGTSSGSIASVSSPMGGVRKRGDNLIAQEANKDTVPSTTPRNFVAKNAKMGGAGAHKDKKKAEKQGSVKHKKPFAEGAVKDLSADLKSMTEQDFIAKYKKTKAAARTAMKSVDESVTEAGYGRNRGYSQGFASPSAPKLGGREYYGQGAADDESNMLYIYVDGRLKQKMVSNQNERQARAQGFRDSQDEALKLHGIIRSKFDPKKFVQNQGGKWVQVFPYGEEQGMAEGYEPPTSAKGSAAYHASLLRKKQERQAAADAKKKEQGMAEATGDERFDTMMGRMQKEPQIPDPQMPPTDVKDLYQWAVKNNKPYHKTFATWANREGFKSVAQALQKAGDLDSDALDYWTPMAWKAWHGDDSEMPQAWSKERIPDELRDYLETVFDAYDNIVFDWPTEYRQIGDQGVAEEWSQKYKSSINCSHPKGFSQKAHCAGKKKHEESMMTMEAVCPDCGMCQTHGNLNEIKKGAKDSNGFTKCWPGHHAAGTKKGKNGGQVRNCVPNTNEAANAAQQAAIAINIKKQGKKPKHMEDHSTASGGWGQGAYASGSKDTSRYTGAGHDDRVHENPDWYNDEANGMTTSQLKSLVKHAAKLRHAVKAMQAQGDTLEPWQQSKVTKAADYLDAVFNAVDDEHDMGEDSHPDEKEDKALIRKMVKAQALKQEDGYMAELQAKLDEKIPKNAPVDVWIKDFEKSNAPQFKGKTKEKRRQMAVAASYGAKNPSKKK